LTHFLSKTREQIYHANIQPQMLRKFAQYLSKETPYVPSNYQRWITSVGSGYFVYHECSQTMSDPQLGVHVHFEPIASLSSDNSKRLLTWIFTAVAAPIAYAAPVGSLGVMFLLAHDEFKTAVHRTKP